LLRYDGTTGASLGLFAHVPSGDNGETILFGPDGNLYYNLGSTDTVKRLNGTSGADLGAFIPKNYGIIRGPYGLAFGPDGDFYVGSSPCGGPDSSLNKVVRYDGATGEMIDTYAAGPEQNGVFAPVFGPDGNLYVSSMYNNSILRYTGPLTAG